MKVKTNLRAGAGGASGVGKNSPDSAADISGKGLGGRSVPVYVPPVSRCVGI